jgi:putative flippase GtrA
MRIFLTRQFASFLLTGGLAAVVNFGSRIIYNQWWGYSTSIVLAYLTGMATAFMLARWFVFRGERPGLGRSMAFFVLVNLLAIVQTWAVSLLLAEQLLPAMGISRYVHELAHAVGVVVPVFTSFLGHKYVSFRTPTP